MLLLFRRSESETHIINKSRILFTGTKRETAIAMYVRTCEWPPAGWPDSRGWKCALTMRCNDYKLHFYFRSFTLKPQKK